MVILAVLLIIVLCVGMGSCSNRNQSNQNENESKPGTTNMSEKDEGNDAEKNEESDKEISGDDVVSWGEATEGIVDDGTADKDVAGENSTGNTVVETPVTDKNTSDDNTTDTNNDDNISLKEYMITYIINNENATMDVTTQTVTYGEEFTLAKPKVAGDDYRFVKWVITGTSTEFKSGTYTVEGDISLTAIWEDNYSKNY